MNSGTAIAALRGSIAGAAASVRQALLECPLPEKDKRALLAHAMGAARERLIAHPEAPVPAAALARFRQLAARRGAGVPMAYLLEEQEFYGHRLRVTPAVLIPRPETEILVERALEAMGQASSGRALDLGTGSGAIAIALAAARPGWTVFASDCCLDALSVAQDNARRVGVAVHWLAGRWLAPVGAAFEVIVSNPPYVAGADPHLEQLACEPRGALTDGADGLSALREIIAAAMRHLRPGGRLLVEHGYDQGPATRRLMQDSGFADVRTFFDLEGRERVCSGARPATGGARLV